MSAEILKFGQLFLKFFDLFLKPTQFQCHIWELILGCYNSQVLFPWAGRLAQKDSFWSNIPKNRSAGQQDGPVTYGNVIR
jgi:hypothetical protein